VSSSYQGATLVVENLQTQFSSRAGIVKAVDDVSFTVQPGQIMGLVGESGSGKSMTGYSIMGLIDAPGKVVGGKILLKGQELRGLSQDAMRDVRGNRIAMIFQDPMMTLNPVLRIDTQMMEAVFAHRKVSRETAREMARDALGRVGIPSPDERLMASRMTVRLKSPMRGRLVPRLGVGWRISVTDSPKIIRIMLLHLHRTTPLLPRIRAHAGSEVRGW